jgi:hypothetical protein
MRGFHSVKPKAGNALPRPEPPPAYDPYEPNSPGYAERHRKTRTVIDGGMVRVDMGEPIRRLPSEAQPVPCKTPKAALASAPTSVSPGPVACLPATPRPLPKQRKEYGLGKGL